MGERGYKVGDNATIYFSESADADDWTCLCTFPHNCLGKLDGDWVRSLALLGAATVLASWNCKELEPDGIWIGFGGDADVVLPYAVPQWIRDEIVRIVPVDEEDGDVEVR